MNVGFGDPECIETLRSYGCHLPGQPLRVKKCAPNTKHSCRVTIVQSSSVRQIHHKSGESAIRSSERKQRSDLRVKSNHTQEPIDFERKIPHVLNLLRKSPPIKLMTTWAFITRNVRSRSLPKIQKSSPQQSEAVAQLPSRSLHIGLAGEMHTADREKRSMQTSRVELRRQTAVVKEIVSFFIFSIH